MKKIIIFIVTISAFASCDLFQTLTDPFYSEEPTQYTIVKELESNVDAYYFDNRFSIHHIKNISTLEMKLRQYKDQYHTDDFDNVMSQIDEDTLLEVLVFNKLSYNGINYDSPVLVFFDGNKRVSCVTNILSDYDYSGRNGYVLVSHSDGKRNFIFVGGDRYLEYEVGALNVTKSNSKDNNIDNNNFIQLLQSAEEVLNIIQEKESLCHDGYKMIKSISYSINLLKDEGKNGSLDDRYFNFFDNADKNILSLYGDFTEYLYDHIDLSCEWLFRKRYGDLVIYGPEYDVLSSDGKISLNYKIQIEELKEGELKRSILWVNEYNPSSCGVVSFPEYVTNGEYSDVLELDGQFGHYKILIFLYHEDHSLPFMFCSGEHWVELSKYKDLTPIKLAISDFREKLDSPLQYYELTGKVCNITNGSYGNFYLVDGHTDWDKVYVYGLTSTKVEKNDRSFSSLGIEEGDIVTIAGLRGEYNDNIQVSGAYCVEHRSARSVTIAEFLDVDKNEYQLYKITATVKEIIPDFSIFGIKPRLILEDNTSEVDSDFLMDFCTSFNSSNNGSFSYLGVKEGDKITVVGYKDVDNNNVGYLKNPYLVRIEESDEGV